MAKVKVENEANRQAKMDAAERPAAIDPKDAMMAELMSGATKQKPHRKTKYEREQEAKAAEHKEPTSVDDSSANVQDSETFAVEAETFSIDLESSDMFTMDDPKHPPPRSLDSPDKQGIKDLNRQLEAVQGELIAASRKSPERAKLKEKAEALEVEIASKKEQMTLEESEVNRIREEMARYEALPASPKNKLKVKSLKLQKQKADKKLAAAESLASSAASGNDDAIPGGKKDEVVEAASKEVERVKGEMAQLEATPASPKKSLKLKTLKLMQMKAESKHKEALKTASEVADRAKEDGKKSSDLEKKKQEAATPVAVVVKGTAITALSPQPDRAKVEKLVTALDTDADGVVSAAEVKVLFSRLLGVPEDAIPDDNEEVAHFATLTTVAMVDKLVSMADKKLCDRYYDAMFTVAAGGGPSPPGNAKRRGSAIDADKIREAEQGAAAEQVNEAFDIEEAETFTIDLRESSGEFFSN